MAATRSARQAKCLRTFGFFLSSVPFDVIIANTPPGRTASKARQKK